MIAGVCAVYGFIKADGLKKRRDFLESFISSLSVIETEIEFAACTLEEIFDRLGDTKSLCRFYGYCRSETAALGIKRAWENAVSSVSDKVCLSPYDEHAVRTLGGELGRSDTRGQKKAIARTRELLRERYKEAEVEYSRGARMYRSCGLLMGAAVVLILL